jgi:hypothetical protein
MNCIVCSKETKYKIILFKTIKSTNSHTRAIRKFKEGKFDGLQIVKSNDYKKPDGLHDFGICRRCYKDIKSEDHEYSWIYKKLQNWKKMKLFILAQSPEWRAYREPKYNYWIRSSANEMTELLECPTMKWLMEKDFTVWSANIIGVKGFTHHCKHEQDELMPKLNINDDDPFIYDDILYKCDICEIVYESWMFKCSHTLEKITE